MFRNELETFINLIKKNSILYEKQINIKDDICCLCLDKLNGKICYECKNCHKGFCLQNKDCKGILEHLNYKQTCPNCIKSFFDSENFYKSNIDYLTTPDFMLHHNDFYSDSDDSYENNNESDDNLSNIDFFSPFTMVYRRNYIFNRYGIPDEISNEISQTRTENIIDGRRHIYYNERIQQYPDLI